jgi:hypothetical protein
VSADTLPNGKRFKYRVRPTREGTLEFPPIRLAYYDTAARAYRTVATAPVPIQARATTQIATADPADGTDALTGVLDSRTRPCRPASHSTRAAHTPFLWPRTAWSAAARGRPAARAADARWPRRSRRWPPICAPAAARRRAAACARRAAAHRQSGARRASRAQLSG